MVEFIAEVSSNHNQDLSRCLAFIDASAGIGCSAVKFQLFKIEELFAPEVLAKDQELHDRKAWELPVEFLPELAGRCRERGIQFACTPFYLQAVEELYPYVDFYKIASYELLWHDLLRACAQTGKPVMLSTGMATLDEISGAVDVLRNAGCCDLTLLHCVSGYPSPPEDCNLAAIETLRQHFGYPIGWSDHTVNPGVIYRAIHRWGAVAIEFHLDLEGDGAEYETGHCWLPERIRPVVELINTGLTADGNGRKVPSLSELSDREWRADPSDGLRPLLHIREHFGE